jgi:hypothetical protein
MAVQNNRLYVGNLTSAAKAETLRAWFGNCGTVSEVQMVVERRDMRSAASAFVTMGTKAAAELAVSRLNGTLLDGKAMLVTVATDGWRGDAEERRSTGKGAKGERLAIAITQQYRERNNMTYELDCAGQALILRIFFPAIEGPVAWRVEARTSDTAQAVVVAAVAGSKQLALGEVSAAWDAASLPNGGPSFDWAAVTLVMQSVRAI